MGNKVQDIVTRIRDALVPQKQGWEIESLISEDYFHFVKRWLLTSAYRCNVSLSSYFGYPIQVEIANCNNLESLDFELWTDLENSFVCHTLIDSKSDNTLDLAISCSDAQTFIKAVCPPEESDQHEILIQILKSIGEITLTDLRITLADLIREELPVNCIDLKLQSPSIFSRYLRHRIEMHPLVVVDLKVKGFEQQVNFSVFVSLQDYFNQKITMEIHPKAA